MNYLPRLLLAAALVAAGQAGAVLVNWYYTPALAALPDVPLTSIPIELGPWTGQPVELDSRLLEGSGAADMINRRYANLVGDSILASIGVWTDYQVQIPHRPELCYATAGWEFLDKKLVQVPLPGGGASPARLLIFRHGGEQIAVLFWCRLAGTVALDDEDVRRFQHQLRGRGVVRPPAIKVTLQTTAFDTEAAERRLLDLAPRLLAHTRQIQ
jgi:hypothetical protein